MKLPEPLFALINPLVSLLLRSPVHRFWSDSLMLISFRGRKSQRWYTTPVRYVAVEGNVYCFTSATNQWWRNVRDGAEVVLRLQGQQSRYLATAIEGEPEQTRKWLIYYLGLFPQDAAYHDIRLNADKSLNAQDLERAVTTAIVVAAKPLADAGSH